MGFRGERAYLPEFVRIPIMSVKLFTSVANKPFSTS